MAEKKNNKEKKAAYTYSIGRRKEAVARVRVYAPGNGKVEIFGNEYKKGEIVVNGKPVQEYFRFTSYAPEYNRILRDTDTSDKYVFSAKVTGGGLAGQIDAIVHGIARALDKIDKEKYHKILKEKGYLTRDPRERERRKVGTGGKARRKKQSPKR